MADLKAREAADELGVHVNTIKRLLQRGEFRGAYQISTRGDWRIPQEAITEFRSRKRAGGSPPA